MNTLYALLFFIGMIMTIVYLVKGLLFKRKPAMKKAGMAGLLMVSSLVLFGVTAPDTEEYLAEGDTAFEESIEQDEEAEQEASEIEKEKAELEAQDKKEQAAEEKREQEAREKEKEQLAKEKAGQEAQEKEEERAAKEEAKEKEAERIAKEQEAQEKEEEHLAKEKADQEVREKEKKASVSFEGYRLIKVDGGNLSGHREANVVVDIGFGDREYWGFTNKHGQLVRVVAAEIILQNDDTEPVNSNGRYYHDEAKVPGTESSSLDEGHVIADSLGGVANAYNITPQESTLNRHGDQAYMERNIMQAGGATNFEANITYPDTNTHIPSKYKYTYTIRGNKVVDEYANVNPDKYNEEQGLTSKPATPKTEEKAEPKVESKPAESSPEGDLSSVDANGNGKVTIQEAKDAGFSMPIRKGHWVYQYMDDRDGDGMVGE